MNYYEAVEYLGEKYGYGTLSDAARRWHFVRGISRFRKICADAQQYRFIKNETARGDMFYKMIYGEDENYREQQDATFYQIFGIGPIR